MRDGRARWHASSAPVAAYSGQSSCQPVSPGVAGRDLSWQALLMSKDPAWLQPLRRPLKMVEVKNLFSRLDRGEGAPEVAMLSEVVLPARVCGLGRLEVLSACSNGLRRVSAGSAAGLTALTELRLARNGLAALPDTVGATTALTRVDLSFNRLARLPAGARG